MNNHGGLIGLFLTAFFAGWNVATKSWIFALLCVAIASLDFYSLWSP
jgi:hypothetical protein